jgi:YVTN family beta-propeller protein
MLKRFGFAFVVLAFASGWAAPAVSLAAFLPDLGVRKAYVGLFKDNAIAVIDLTTNQLIGMIPVPAGPHGVVITPDGSKVYVSSEGASTVSVIDTATDRVVRSLEVGPTPHGLAISRDGHLLLVAGFGSNEVILINTVTDRIIGSVGVPQPHNAAISPDGGTAYVASPEQGNPALVVLDLASRIKVGRVPLDKAPRALAFTADGRRLYFTMAGSDSVQILDPATKQIVSWKQVGTSPRHPLFTPDGQIGLVVSQGPDELTILDPVTNTILDTVGVGQAPHGIATGANGHFAYVTNEGSNDVSVVDLASYSLLANIPVGNAPRKIAVQPGPIAVASVSAVAPTPAPVRLTLVAGPSRQSGGSGRLMAIDRETQEVQGETKLILEADDSYFTPAVLRGEPGQRLRLEVENESGMLHTISIPEQQIDTNIPPHGKVVVEVTFPQSGRVRFFYTLHTALGLDGRLAVGDVRPQPVPSGATGQTYSGLWH